MSGTQPDSAVPTTGQQDAGTGEADEVSDYSEEAGVFDAADRSDDAAEPADSADFPADGAAADGADYPADGAAADAEADGVLEQFMRELRMLPGDWYVVHSYAGYENRVKTNLESRIQ